MKKARCLHLALVLCSSLPGDPVGAQQRSAQVVRLGVEDGYVETQVAEPKGMPDVLPTRTYHWLKGQRLHVTQGGIAGRPLHGAYRSFRGDGQLEEAGWFVFGLKHGEWCQWYPDGRLKEVSNWRSGLREGVSRTYDTNGSLISEVRYRAGKAKSGRTREEKKKRSTRRKKEDPEVGSRQSEKQATREAAPGRDDRRSARKKRRTPADRGQDADRKAREKGSE